MSKTIDDFLDEINKNIKEAITRVEQRQIELEAEYKKNNELILQELKNLLVKYKVHYKSVSLV